MGFIESLSLEQRIVGSIVSIAVAAIITRLTKPILWLRGNRSLKTLLNKDRDFVFTFNPTTKASKVVTFLANGEIGKGRNINEHTWKITKGGLDIFSQNGKLYSRFIYDKASGMLKHTNDANTRSIPGQYIQPHYLPQTESDISSKGRTG